MTRESGGSFRTCGVQQQRLMRLSLLLARGLFYLPQCKRAQSVTTVTAVTRYDIKQDPGSELTA